MNNIENNKTINNNIILSGVGAGLLEHYIGYIPRTILDHNQTNKNYFKSNSHILREIYKKNGFRGFFTGNLPMISSISFSHAWFFYLYEKNKSTQTPYLSILYSTIAKIGHDLLMIPGDIIRMRTNISGQNNLQVIKSIYRTGGIGGFFNSSPYVLAMNIPSGIIEFSVMKNCSQRFGDENYKIFIYGGIAGIASSIINNPLDIIKTHVQSQGLTNQFTHEVIPNYKSGYQLFKNLYKDFGLRGFLRGAPLRSFQCSICYGSYELLNSFNFLEKSYK